MKFLLARFYHFLNLFYICRSIVWLYFMPLTQILKLYGEVVLRRISITVVVCIHENANFI